MQIGNIGLGWVGANMVRRLLRGGQPAWCTTARRLLCRRLGSDADASPASHLTVPGSRFRSVAPKLPWDRERRVQQWHERPRSSTS
jgi:hypothetical protein